MESLSIYCLFQVGRVILQLIQNEVKNTPQFMGHIMLSFIVMRFDHLNIHPYWNGQPFHSEIFRKIPYFTLVSIRNRHIHFGNNKHWYVVNFHQNNEPQY